MRHVEVTQLLGDILAQVGVIDKDSPYTEDVLVAAAQTFLNSIQPPLIKKYFDLHKDVERIWGELSEPCMNLPEFTHEYLDKTVDMKYSDLIRLADELGRTLEENHPEKSEHITQANVWYQPTYLSIGGAYQMKAILAKPVPKIPIRKCPLSD